MQVLRGTVFAPADRASHDHAGAERLRDDLHRFTEGSETACNGELAIVLNNRGTPPLVVFFKLLIALDIAVKQLAQGYLPFFGLKFLDYFP